MSVVETDPERGKASLSSLQGGRGSNWLGKLSKGTSFLSRENGTHRFDVKESPPKYFLRMFQISEKTDRGVLLLQPNYMGGPDGLFWVDPVEFSLMMDPFEIFPLGQEEDVTRNDEDG